MTDIRAKGFSSRAELEQYLEELEDDGGPSVLEDDDDEVFRAARKELAWGATCMAVEVLASLEAATTKRALARQLNDAVDQVAAKLVNTRSVCRSSYIHPAVFEDFQAGTLGDVLKLTTRSARLLQWMDEEEIRVVRWLKSREGGTRTSA